MADQDAPTGTVDGADTAPEAVSLAVPIGTGEARSLYFGIHEFWMREVPYPAEWIADRWMPLAGMCDAIRAAWGGPLTVISGYRSAAYNQYLTDSGHNVAKNSQHIQGRAADLRPAHVPSETLYQTTKRLHALVLDLYGGGKLPLLGGLGVYEAGWVHVDTRAHDPGVLARWTG